MQQTPKHVSNPPLDSFQFVTAFSHWGAYTGTQYPIYDPENDKKKKGGKNHILGLVG